MASVELDLVALFRNIQMNLEGWEKMTKEQLQYKCKVIEQMCLAVCEHFTNDD